MKIINVKKLRHKQLLIGISIVGVIVVAMIGWLVWNKLSSKIVDAPPAITPVSSEDMPAAVRSYVDRNAIDEGLSFLDDQIAVQEQVKDKGALLVTKSDFALDAERYSIALDAAKQAYAIDPGYSASLATAKAYEGLGDKKQAIVYYKKALADSPDEGPASRYNYVWEAKIKELSS